MRKTMIAVISWEIDEREMPGICLCKDLKEAREELLEARWDDDHTNDDGCRLGPLQLELAAISDLGKDPPEITCELCRVEGWDPAEEDFYMYPHAGRGDMQICATVVEVPE